MGLGSWSARPSPQRRRRRPREAPVVVRAVDRRRAQDGCELRNAPVVVRVPVVVAEMFVVVGPTEGSVGPGRPTALRRRRALDPRVRRREINANIGMIRQQGPEDGEAHVGVDGEEERRPVRTGTVVVARDVLAQTLAQDVRRPRERNAADTVLLT